MKQSSNNTYSDVWSAVKSPHLDVDTPTKWALPRLSDQSQALFWYQPPLSGRCSLLLLLSALWTPSWMYKEDYIGPEQEEKSLFGLGSSSIFTLWTAQCFICHGGGESVSGPARCGRPPAGGWPTSDVYY